MADVVAWRRDVERKKCILSKFMCRCHNIQGPSPTEEIKEIKEYNDNCSLTVLIAVTSVHEWK